MMNDYFKRVSRQTATRFWVNNVTLSEADKGLAAGAVGCTQNPAYVWKILNGSQDQARAEQLLQQIMADEPDDTAALIRLQRALVSDVAARFRPLFEASQHQLGYVSIQGSPIEEDTETILRAARFNVEAGPNIMAKIPVTQSGLKAIAVLAKEGVPINATECMAVRQVLDVCETYVEVTRGMPSPAPLYFSLITGIYDEYLHKHVAAHNIDVDRDALWQAGLSVARKVHEIVRQRKYPCGFIGGGARGLHHFTEMVGADASITINWVGTADKLIEQDGPVVSRFLQPTPAWVEDELLEKLEDHRKAFLIHAIEPDEYEDYGPVELFRSNFTSAWNSALAYIGSLR
jgi:transaldolase